MFGGGGKGGGTPVQSPQVASSASEPHETGRTLPQSEAEAAAIKKAEDDERRRQTNKTGQQETIISGGTGAFDETGYPKKTLLGA